MFTMMSPKRNNQSFIILPWIALALYCIFSTDLAAQELRTYNIACDPNDFSFIIDNPWSDHYIDCSFEYNDQLWEGVQIRIRGESSRGYPKKSFKVNFSAEHRFFGRDKLNLISEYTDPTLSREFLAYDLYHRAGLYASHAWFARIIVNDEYLGLYLDVENVDEFYLRGTELDNNSSIYKADLNGTILSVEEDVEELWAKQTNTISGFYDLNNLIEWLDCVSDNDFFDELKDRFDPNELARTISVNSLCANTSTYYHNYFLIHNIEEDGLWRILPWDMDATWIYSNFGKTPYYFRSGHPIQNKINVLLRRCWRDEEFQNLAIQHMKGMIDSVFTVGYYNAKTDSIEALILRSIEDDPHFQFSIDDFTTAIRKIPVLVQQRAAALTNMINNAALPFELHPARVVPEGVFLAWEPTEYATGPISRYRVQISNNSTFLPDRIEYFVNQTYSLYTELEPGTYFWRVHAFSPTDQITQSISFFLPISIPENFTGSTKISGKFDTSTTWTIDNSPYVLTGDVTVAPGATLTIDSGVDIGMENNSVLIIQGGLLIEGSIDDSVQFFPTDVSPEWNGIFIDNPTDPVMINYADFYNAHGGPNNTSPEAAIHIETGEITLSNCTFRDGDAGGILSRNSDVFLIGTRLSGFGGNSVEVTNGSLYMKNCRVTSDKSNNAGDLVSIYESRHVQIQSSFFYGGDDIINLDKVPFATISGNTIKQARDKGITIGWGSKNIRLDNNIITRCDIGVTIHENSEVKLYNNVIAFNKTGLELKNTVNGNSTLVRNTVIWRNDKEISQDEFANLSVAYSLVRGSKPFPGENNQFENANFIDQWNDNYRLRDDSPLIDAGWGSDCPNRDFDMLLRVDMEEIANTGAGEIAYVDIGAYEFGSTVDTPIIPETFELFSIYPNPFNKTTRITFEVQHSVTVEISIFNGLGRTLLSQKFYPPATGRYTYNLNASDLAMSSGLYFVRLKQSGKYSTHRVVLIK